MNTLEELHTMAEMAALLDKPESTIRSHCHRFKEFLPYAGKGRERRYHPEALQVLRAVAECYSRKMTTGQIMEFLAREFPRNIEPQQPATTEQQQPALTQQQFAAILMWVAGGQQQLVEELQAVREELASIKQQQSAVDKFIVEWRAQQERKNRPTWRRWLGI